MTGGSGKDIKDEPLTAKVTRSILLLDSVPYRPRLMDSRIGIFPTIKKEYSATKQTMRAIYYANRWRLEPSDLKSYVEGKKVTPVKPIVFYVDSCFPDSWKASIFEAVNQWNEPFEKIGFIQAIQAKEFPKDDPEFDADNLKYSCIRYAPIAIENAMGPSWVDPRSGEILNASVYLYHDVIKLLNNWIFIQTAQADKRVRHKIIPREVMDDALRYVVSHEVGHCLGFMHNMSASSVIPVDSLRSPSFTQKHGTTTSIMDYARFNYVAQPGDMERGVRMMPPYFGLYDDYLIRWNYTPVPEAKTPEEEYAITSKWITDLSDNPVYRYGKQQSDILDPRSQTEDLGDDAMLASSYGIKNLKRVMPEIMNWTYEPNEGYMKAVRLYQNVVGQFDLYMGHVATNVAGIYHNPISVEQTDMKAVEYVPKDIQKKAVDFLNKELFTTPTWLMDDKLSERTGINTFNSIYRVQSSTLKQLLSSRTLDKMTDNELVNGAKAYTANDLFRDLKKSIWSDMQGGKKPDASQRSLQKTYVNALIGMLDKPKNSSGSLGSLGGYSLVAFDFPSEAPTIARGQLTDLRRDLTNAANASSGIYRSHYLNLKALIDAAFDVK